ncbi:MAG: phosphoglycerate kinase [bacterium]
MSKMTVEDFSPKGKRILVRCDFNVPINDGIITDNERIIRTLPTIKYLIEKGGRVILLSHLGRPKGKPVPEMSLRPVAGEISKLLGIDVIFVDDCVGEKTEKIVFGLNDGQCCLLENVRFYEGEEKGDETFAKCLASLGEVFVMEAFGAVHRPHASVYKAPIILGGAYAGFLMISEIDYLSRALYSPEHPYVLVLGGAKLETKIGVIDRLLDVSDAILIGGALSYTFLKVMGHSIGSSIFEEKYVKEAESALSKAVKLGSVLLLPQDHIVSESSDSKEGIYIGSSDIPDDMIGFDIGEKTIEQYSEVIKNAKLVFWNGPMGYFENPVFSVGTNKICSVIAESEATKIAGGGETILAINNLGLSNKFNHISTGGGASLEFLEGKKLPGIEVIKER